MQLKLLFIFIIICSYSFGSPLIKGKIIGNRINEFIIYEPINSFFNLNNRASCIIVKADKNNTFSVVLDTKENLGFVVIKIEENFFYIVFERNDSFYLDINLNEKTGTIIKIYGQNSVGNMMMNAYLSEPLSSFALLYNYLDKIKSEPLNAILFFKYILNEKTKFLDSLYTLKKITNAFYSLSKKTIYASQANEFLKPFLRPSAFHRLYNNVQLNQIIDSIFLLIDPNDLVILKAFNGGFYTSTYYENLEKKIKHYETIYQLNDTTIIAKDNKTLKISKNYAPFLHIKNEKIKEYLWGSLLFDIISIYPETVTENDIDAFKLNFPNSIFLEEIQKKVSIKDIKKVKENTEIVIDTSSSVKSLSDIHSIYFKNRIVYIDLWATWCIPCKNEFQYNISLDSFFKFHNIERLYVSFDDISNIETWINNIYLFNLNGINFIVNNELKKSILKQIFNNTSTYTIPRYVLMDKNGVIITTNAPRPSSPKLKELIEKYLKE